MTIQLPFCDLRKFCAAAEATIVDKPIWPDPEFPQFVRFFGGIVDRRSGGLDGFPENSHCEIRNAVRLSRTAPLEFGGRSTLSRVRDSRLFTDGIALVKFEIAISVRLARRGIFGDELMRILDTLLTQKVSIRNPKADAKRKVVELGKASSWLHTLYSRATTCNGCKDRSDLIFPLRPMIHVALYPTESVIEPKKSLPIHADGHIPLYYFKFTARQVKQFMPTWLQAPSTETPKSKARRLRIALLRLHAEYETFRNVAEQIYIGSIDPKAETRESEMLQDYIERSIDVFLNDEKQLPDDAIRLALRNLSLVKPGMVDAILHKLKFGTKIRGTLHRNLKLYIEGLKNRSPQGVSHAGPISVENVTGNVIINSTAGESINATVTQARDQLNVDLAKLLEELGVYIIRACELMDDRDAVDVANRFKSLSLECSQSSPDPSILRAIGSAITDRTSGIQMYANRISRMIGAVTKGNSSAD